MSKAEILDELPKLGPDDRREILERLCALEDSALTAMHQRFVDEALASGPAREATPDMWQQALERGLVRAGKPA